MRTRHEFEPAMLYICPFVLCGFQVATSALYLSVMVILISSFWSPFLEGEVGKSAAIQQCRRTSRGGRVRYQPEECNRFESFRGPRPPEQSFETPSYPSLIQGDRGDDETKD
ncbi:hypothetical protein BDN70DRAFT_879060 [Pholiota conissans]|uniref:Uncharacterized protein n=1 Tax=Pholiota conissans TaxID=109636 RepID=A0A9P5Z312_9AGAR|nr:hypothetical protein BDN70DRAFT_879060 [Pholiota conissans]